MTKAWLITGSSRGFGRALTEAVLAGGDRVVATARRPEQLNDLVRTYGNRIRAVALDVTDAAAARAAVQLACDAFGSLDVVVKTRAMPCPPPSRICPTRTSGRRSRPICLA